VEKRARSVTALSPTAIEHDSSYKLMPGHSGEVGFLWIQTRGSYPRPPSPSWNPRRRAIAIGLGRSARSGATTRSVGRKCRGQRSPVVPPSTHSRAGATRANLCVNDDSCSATKGTHNRSLNKASVA
jgi:hypothetical protein